MKILGIRTIDGPNVHHHEPVLVMQLDLEEFADVETHRLPGFVDSLTALLPGLAEHHCAAGRPGGFIERLHGGTLLGHVVEHVALEMSEAAGAPAFYGKTRSTGEPGRYVVIVEYISEAGMRHLLSTAVRLVEALAHGQSFDVASAVNEARRIVADAELGPSTRAIVDAAEERGIPWRRLNEGNLIQLGHGRHRRIVQAAMSDRTSAVGVEVVGDKVLTKRLLEEAGIPVPRGRLASDVVAALHALEDLRAPVVVKPRGGRQGKGVSTNIRTAEELQRAFDLARDYDDEVIVEEQLIGRDYRVLVVGGAMAAASERQPAHVVGDGVHTIAELVPIANRDPRRGEGHERPLTKLSLDAACLSFLAGHQRRPEDVPRDGELVQLRQNANLSTGGTAVDVTDAVHPELVAVCERAARLLGLDICGVDLIAPDIRGGASGAGIVEINAAPGLRMHQYPSHGTPRDAGRAIVDMLFPEGEGRIPTVAVTGTNGKTTVTRMIAHVLSAAGHTVGMTTTDGVFIGGACVARGDMTGPHSARMVLGDPAVTAAVLETARGGIVRRGLGWDRVDVAVLTNIQRDHLGQDGLEDLDDVLHVKSLVAERVRRGGTLVLNADDAMLRTLPEAKAVRRRRATVAWFTLDGSVTDDSTRYSIAAGWLVEREGSRAHRILDVADVPATLGGTADFNVANVLAAVAACRALGVDRALIARALAAFDNGRQNAGRSNLFRLGDGHVVIDYGHNPAAFRAVGGVVRRWGPSRTTAVIGVPGDRGDALIEEAGRAAAQAFDRLFVRDDVDLRGRRPGETSALLCRAANAERPDCFCVLIQDERRAVEQALTEIQPGEVVVIFYDELDLILDLLRAYGAIPTDAIDAWRTLPDAA